MLNFAEQTGSGAVMLVWSFPTAREIFAFVNLVCFLTYRMYDTYPTYRTIRKLENENEKGDPANRKKAYRGSPSIFRL